MPEDSRPFSLSEVLSAELLQLRPEAAADLAGLPPARDEHGVLIEANEPERRRQVYGALLRHRLSALCLSGGGIRSASISLGVIQALADKALLREFNYLSTVSGGGYIGSWLSAWLHRTQDANEVIAGLRQERSDSDHEPPPLSHLRRYSNYLTPKLGIFSADTWTAVAIILRNLVVNWLILIPAIALPVIVVKLLATVLISDSIGNDAAVYIAALCLVMGWMALSYKLYRLYAPPTTRDTEVAQNRFLLWSLLPAAVAGLCFVWLLLRQKTPADALGFDYSIPWLDSAHSGRPFGPMLEFAVAVFIGALALSLIDKLLFGTHVRDAAAQRRYGIGIKNTAAWLVGVAVFAILIWAGARYIGDLNSPVTLIGGTLDRRLLAVIFGMPWFLMATMSAHTVYLLLRSGSGTGDVEREWLGRASGWHFIAGFSWILLAAIVLLGPKLYYNAEVLGQNAGKWLTALTATSGSVTAFLGKSGITPAKGAASGSVGIGSNIVLAIAAPLFAVLLLIMISLILDWPIAGNSQACFPPENGTVCGAESWVFWLVGIVILLGVVDGFANVNRFSIHALYRNRLVRAFLGGARAPDRKPDGFTDFDWGDNVRMASLWHPDRPVDKDRNWRPFHVVNMTLNLAATKNLAWQQRKASSFAVTPLYCGNADLGYRPTEMYGGPVEHPIGPREQGITLGTAMAISGAAVSSNMGYHSSPSLAFLLTLFNVRLGWWLGNPGAAGGKRLDGLKAPYEREGPLFALRPLISELLGMTSADSPYVYLSDGGHFEDLGLYEMVRRRCRWIILCDGDQDRARGFEDLGNAVRKIWIDLGVRITFADAPLIQAAADAKSVDIPYFALGTIHYINESDARPGKILYIKPGVRGDEEAADVIAYKRANPEFPAQSTGDQWFDEAQLETYRRLGYLMACRIIEAVPAAAPGTGLERLLDGLAAIDPKTMKPRQESPSEATT
jgi:hypothetical protein